MDYAHRVLHVIFFSRISPVPVREIPGTRLAIKLVLVPRALTLSLESVSARIPQTLLIEFSRWLVIRFVASENLV